MEYLIFALSFFLQSLGGFSSNVKRQFLLDLLSWELCAHLIGSAVQIRNKKSVQSVNKNCGISETNSVLQMKHMCRTYAQSLI